MTGECGWCRLQQESGTAALLRGKLERLQREGGGGGGSFSSQVSRHSLLLQRRPLAATPHLSRQGASAFCRTISVCLAPSYLPSSARLACAVEQVPLLRGRPCTRSAPRSCHVILLASRRRGMGGAGTAPGGAAGREGRAPQRLCRGRPAEAAGQGDDGEGARAGGGAARFPSDTAHRGRPLPGRPDGLAHWGSCCIMAESASQQCATRVEAEFLCPFSLEVGPLAIAHVRGCSERS